MQSINGSTEGGSPIHADNPKDVAYVTQGDTGQGNGRVTPKITTHMMGNSGPQAGERGIGDISKDMYGSMNGKEVGQDVDLKRGV